MNNSVDTLLFYSLIERHEKLRMPIIRSIEQKADHGDRLNDYEINFLHETFCDLQKIQPIIERHPEYQVLFSRFADLCKHISTKAFENESN